VEEDERSEDGNYDGETFGHNTPELDVGVALPVVEEAHEGEPPDAPAEDLMTISLNDMGESDTESVPTSPPAADSLRIQPPPPPVSHPTQTKP
jgi:hypothetical protein